MKWGDTVEVTVKMSMEEFREFMEYQADKERYERDLVRIRRIPEAMATSLRFAVEPVEGKEDKYKIVSQEHMADVMEMVEEFAIKKQKTTRARCLQHGAGGNGNGGNRPTVHIITTDRADCKPERECNL